MRSASRAWRRLPSDHECRPSGGPKLVSRVSPHGVDCVRSETPQNAPRGLPEIHDHRLSIPCSRVVRIDRYASVARLVEAMRSTIASIPDSSLETGRGGEEAAIPTNRARDRSAVGAGELEAEGAHVDGPNSMAASKIVSCDSSTQSDLQHTSPGNVWPRKANMFGRLWTASPHFGQGSPGFLGFSCALTASSQTTRRAGRREGRSRSLAAGTIPRSSVR